METFYLVLFFKIFFCIIAMHFILQKMNMEIINFISIELFADKNHKVLNNKLRMLKINKTQKESNECKNKTTIK